MTGIRSFLALSTTDVAKGALARLQSDLKQVGADVKWDPPEKFHITLKFLGNVEEQKLRKLAVELSPAVARFREFDLTYVVLGVFPPSGHARVLWVGAEPEPLVMELQGQIESVCEQHGFRREDHPFHPHITLGRVKGTRGIGRLTQQMKIATFEPISSRCSGVLLFKSDLQPTGSVYTVLQSFSFSSTREFS